MELASRYLADAPRSYPQTTYPKRNVALGELYAERGEAVEAIMWLQRLNVEDPDEIEQLSALLEQTGGAAAAEEWLRDRSQSDVTVGLIWAEWLEKHGRSTEAQQYLLTEIDSGNSFAWMALVHLLQQKGQSGELEQILRRTAEKGNWYMMQELAEALRCSQQR